MSNASISTKIFNNNNHLYYALNRCLHKTLFLIIFLSYDKQRYFRINLLLLFNVKQHNSILQFLIDYLYNFLLVTFFSYKITCYIVYPATGNARRMLLMSLTYETLILLCVIVLL